MSSSVHADAFYREVIASGELFTVEHEEDGPIEWHLAGGIHARPFWSARSRAVRMLQGPLRRRGLVIVPVIWHEFCSRIVPEMRSAGQLVGLNWHGARARGYNLDPDAVVQAVESMRIGRAAG
ncbi:MAG: DUF2750 domain-containing protein [Phycisphaeraceae bacterium]|nr:MAG: DUF2750 domain-containing protein [Phycisphaeraceae bacterium]